MGKRFVRCLAVAVFAVLVTMTWVTGAAAQVTLVSACGTLSTFGETYKLTGDLTTVFPVCGDCLTLANNRITVNMQGHKISPGAGCGTGASGIFDGGTALDQIIIKDGEISDSAGGEQFVIGINLFASTRTEVRNIYSHGNFFYGILVGNQSIVAGLPNVTPKTCRAVFNGVVGIFGGDRVQVQNCEASNNGDLGIFVGKRCLVTRNIANFNGHNGIEAGTGDDPPNPQGFCDVTFNTANNNGGIFSEGGSGIDVEGTNSLITGNTTNNNTHEGLSVQCPSTVTNNNSSGNVLNYEFEGLPACFQSNNN